MDTEIELKFLVSDTVISQLPALITKFAKKVSNKPARNLQNAYFDTSSRELRALDIGLRTRCADGVCEQTIKLAGKVVGGLHQRPEFNIPIPNNRPNLSLFDPSIWPMGMQPNTIAENLFPIFSTNFVRRTWLIETESGSQIELVLDKGEIAASGQVESICEVEVELVSGEREALFEFARQLIDLSGVRLGLYSKAARGYRLADNNPLQADFDMGVVPLTAHDSQEEALEKCIQYGIEFVQKHEQCYVQEPNLTTLKRIVDGVSVIRHAFWLFEAIVDKQQISPLRKELKWLLQTLSWVEGGIQLELFTSRKHAYYKRISSEAELEQVVVNLQQEQPKFDDLLALFQSARYNHLILSLTIWLVEKGWRKTWSQNEMNAASTPVKELAAEMFAKDWLEMQHLLPPQDVSAEDYLAKQVKLHRNLLSGCCLGGLFEGDQRETFRAPWLDIIYGMDELATLKFLKQLCTEQAEQEKFESILAWLEQKTQGLVSAMEQSRQVSQKLEPYWQ